MSDLELMVAELERENQRLQQENNTLRQVTGSLTKENVGLKERLGMELPTGAECVSESAVLSSTPLPKEKAHTLLLWMAHCLALLMTSKTNCSASLSKSPKNLHLKNNPHLQKQLLKLMSQSKRKWWGPQQRSWTPTMN